VKGIGVWVPAHSDSFHSYCGIEVQGLVFWKCGNDWMTRKDIYEPGHRRAGTRDHPSRTGRRQQRAARKIREEGTQNPRMLQVRLQQFWVKARAGTFVFHWAFATGTTGVSRTVAEASKELSERKGQEAVAGRASSWRLSACSP